MHNPLAVCLRETFLKDTGNITFRGFNFHIKNVRKLNTKHLGVYHILLLKIPPLVCSYIKYTIKQLVVVINLLLYDQVVYRLTIILMFIRTIISILLNKSKRQHYIHNSQCYLASDIWLKTILIVRKETRCRHIGYS